MPSYPRRIILGDDCYFHITWRCHNRSWLLASAWAKQLYYSLLLRFKDEYGVAIYSYNFMDSHPHLTGFGRTQNGVSNLMKRVNGIFARSYNKKMGRCGQVVMDRFRSPLIQTDAHLLTVMTYIDMNPVRAKMVAHPMDYQWTSYPYYAHGQVDPLITPAPSYLALGTTPHQRQRAYQLLVDDLMLHDRRRRAFSTSHFIGNPDWVIEKCRNLFRQRLASRSPNGAEFKANLESP